MTIGITRDHDPYTQPLSLRSEGRQQCPAFQARACRVGSNGHEVIKEPGMFYYRNRVCLQPDTQYLLIGSVLLSCLDTKA